MLRVVLRSKTKRSVLLSIARSWSVLTAMDSPQQKPKLQVNVDITSDVACPWCWIGKRHLDAAVQKLHQDFEFHVHWKPFLLNPHVPEEGIPLADYLRQKFGQQAAERFLTGQSPIAQHGQAVGISFNPSRLVVPTRKSHILLDYAVKEGKQHELQEVIFRAYFAEGRNVNDSDVLRDLVTEVGLDADRALAALGDTEAIRHYEEGVREAQRKAVTGVPHFEIYLADNPDIRQQFSGAQPIDTFISIFNRLRMLAKV